MYGICAKAQGAGPGKSNQNWESSALAVTLASNSVAGCTDGGRVHAKVGDVYQIIPISTAFGQAINSNNEVDNVSPVEKPVMVVSPSPSIHQHSA
ncbi:hypothetical protein PAXRUDRAFT_829671 [Paxillus rubicundulus Ve08.2h10]|uniref:Uncharacterized protein n=1 Tax=Paxillus rubicundulus Ve08.2h10 TaxID=930991 RepID=A0A0D0DZS7_9AGAM|nr:hypothetical protein PAXRUDRAFT_829671 [Paxillus rubicundulus Ve08.2h10]